jgi:hypothetical protein
VQAGVMLALRVAASERLECGASVPLYGQAGGGVEVKFTRSTFNRWPDRQSNSLIAAITISLSAMSNAVKSAHLVPSLGDV